MLLPDVTQRLHHGVVNALRIRKQKTNIIDRIEEANGAIERIETYFK